MDATPNMREKSIYDEISAIESSKEEGIKEGIEKGLKEVVEKGKKSLLKGFDLEDISEITGLSKDEILKIKSEL